MSQWYGSVQNRIMERMATPKLEIGMGVTKCLWSDCRAYEIIAIKDDRHITVRRMGTKCIDGWRERIGKNGLGDTRFAVGYAREYEDPSF